MHRYVLASLMNGAIARLTQADQVIVLGDHLAGRPGEVDRQRGHGAAEVVHVEDQFRMQIRSLPPDDPPYARIYQSVLVTGRINRFDSGQPEVPPYVGVQKRSDEASARAIDMNRDVESGLFLQTVEGGAQGFHVLIVARVRTAHHSDHADS